MNYKSFADLSRDVKANLNKIPKDVTLVVGIPRSGLLAANLIALYLNLPLTDIDSFMEGKVLCQPFREKGFAENAFKGKILIVDDSVATGKAIVDARQKLAPIIDSNKYELVFCCIYADPDKTHMVDIALLQLGRPRVFEWNIFHNKVLEKACVNIDGVLCIEPSAEVEKEKYLNSLLNATPLILPKRKIATLVTSRKELYRAQTEAWLKKHHVQYDELVMLAEYEKGAAYKKRKNNLLFIETDPQQAQEIFKATGKDVYCLGSNEMFSSATNNSTSNIFYKRSSRLINRVKRKLKTFF